MPADEFETIARLLRPLTRGHPAALDLGDDAAVLSSREGHDLVITKDALVEGVHFLAEDPLDLVARKLLRANLSDLAAMGAEPFGYLLACAWSARCGWTEREAFASGLALDGQAFGLSLLGGDTVSTPGPLVLSATLLGWTPRGRAVRRGGARSGDLLLVSGPVGDGYLGLKAARNEIADPGGYLAGRYRLPTPRLDLRSALLCAHASADISDGLLADAGNLARASGLAVEIDLAAMPLSPAARAWLDTQPNRQTALLQLATGGDDYQLIVAAAQPISGFTAVGRCGAGEGVSAFLDGVAVPLPVLGWRHA